MKIIVWYDVTVRKLQYMVVHNKHYNNCFRRHLVKPRFYLYYNWIIFLVFSVVFHWLKFTSISLKSNWPWIDWLFFWCLTTLLSLLKNAGSQSQCWHYLFMVNVSFLMTRKISTKKKEDGIITVLKIINNYQNICKYWIWLDTAWIYVFVYLLQSHNTR